MKETVELMRFLRHDPVGQRLGVSILVLGWLALAWTSLGMAVGVPVLLAISELVRRRREQQTPVVDDLEDLY